MSDRVKYIQFAVSIHGLDADAEAIELLRQKIKCSLKDDILTGDDRDRFNFRNDFDDDIEVEFVECAGGALDKANKENNRDQ